MQWRALRRLAVPAASVLLGSPSLCVGESKRRSYGSRTCGAGASKPHQTLVPLKGRLKTAPWGAMPHSGVQTAKRSAAVASLRIPRQRPTGHRDKAATAPSEPANQP